MPLSPSTPVSSLGSALAVERLRRHAIYCAPSIDLVDPSDHALAGAYGTTSHRVVAAVRHRAGSTMTIRPLDAAVTVTSARRIQWMVLDVPAARVPAGFVWAQLGRSAQLDFASPVLLLPIVFTPSAALDSWLYASTTPAVIGTYQAPQCAIGGQVLAPGRALLLVVARLGANDPICVGSLRVEVCDE